MKFAIISSTLALVGMLVTAAGSTVSAQSYPGDSGAGIELGMAAQNASGEVGTVTLFRRGEKTLVVLKLSGAPHGPQPAHVHRGTCETLDPKPAYPLANAVDGRSQTLLPVPIDRLLSGNYSVNVHQSTTNIARYVSCGHLYRA
jgi:Cu/Zn superoxide dismutase